MSKKSLWVWVCLAALAAGCSDDSAGVSIKSPCSTENETACNSEEARVICTNGVYELSPCENGFGCLDGQCAEKCDVGTYAVSCSDSSRVYCSAQGFVVMESCENGCESGRCKENATDTPECVESNYDGTCADDNTRTVCENGKIVKKSCESGQVCKGGSCVNEVSDATCEEASFEPKCQGTTAHIVCEGGHETQKSCLDGEICNEQGECTTSCGDGYKGCANNGSRLWCENGQVKNESCAAGLVCVDGECRMGQCTNGYVGCSENGASRVYCQNGTLKSEICTGGMVCDPNDGLCKLPSGGLECDEAVFKPTCSASGKPVKCEGGKTVEGAACLDNQTCYLGECIESAPCAVSTYTPSCKDGTTSLICENSKITPKTCQAGEICEGGVCQKIAESDECTNGDVSCSSEKIAMKCENGKWHKYYCNVSAQTCNSGVCKDTDTLTETCVETSYKAKCDKNTKLVCEYGYISKYDCGTGRHCDSGICYDDIKLGDPCDAATFAAQCLPDGSQAVCEGGKIVSKSCGNQICVAGQCTACTEDNYKTTCADGLSQAVCVNGLLEKQSCGDNKHCESGVCKDDPKPGDTCDPASFSNICNAAGSLISCDSNKVKVESCPTDTPFCMADKCVQCDPAGFGQQCQVAADGKAAILTCNADGSIKSDACASGEVCYKNQCAACDPTVYKPSCDASGNTVRCDENGTIQTKACASADLHCKDGACTKTCTDKTQCPEHNDCVSGECQFVPECAVGTDDIKCASGNKATLKCIDPGIWQETACKANEICSNGLCLGTECTGNAKDQCKDNKPSKCENGYITPVDSECTGLNAVCVKGSCVPCEYGKSPNVCTGTEFKKCLENNTYEIDKCESNETCDTAKGCVSKCGAGFKESCVDGKRTYCDETGKQVTANCNYDEKCDPVTKQCKSDKGTPCDANTLDNSCVEDTTGIPYLRQCDPGTKGIVYIPCNNANSFCGTLASLTGCFQKCTDTSMTTCLSSSGISTDAEIGPCIAGKTYKSEDVYGLRLSSGYCKDGFSTSCYTDSTGKIVFNRLYCPLIEGGTCDEKTGKCGAIASCPAPSAKCEGNRAQNCAYDVPSHGNVLSNMDCAALNTTCVSYTHNGVSTATCQGSANFKIGTGEYAISSTGTCVGKELWMLYWTSKNTYTAWHSECDMGCVSMTDSATGVAYSYCK